MVFIGVHIGQCGIQQGHSFWSLIDSIACSEAHEQLIGCVTTPLKSLYRPLCVNVDLESKAYTAIKSAKFRKLHCGNFTCFGSGQERGAGGVFGAGYVAAVQPNQPDGTSVVESVLEGIRRHAESASSSAHFFLTHSLAGGTGSGAGAAILAELRDSFPAQYIVTASTAASSEGEVPCQAYNSILMGAYLQEHSDCALLVCNRLGPSTLTGSGKSHQEINTATARGLAGMLLPLQGGNATYSAQPMADLATFVTPEPALRFAELWSSPVGAQTGLQALVQQLSSSMPRYTNAGGTIKTGSSLIVARGQLPGHSSMHARQMQGSSVVRGAFLSKQKESCRDCSWVTARHASMGLPLSTAGPNTCMLGSALSGSGTSPGRTERRAVRGSDDQPLITAATNRSSIGEFWGQYVQQAAMKLKQNAYVHWYERAGCVREELVGAVHLMHDAALSYDWCFRP